MAEVEDGNGAVGLEAGSEFEYSRGAFGDHSGFDEPVELLGGGLRAEADCAGDIAPRAIALARGEEVEDGPALPASEHGMEIGAAELRGRGV